MSEEAEARSLTGRINEAGDELARAFVAQRNDTGAYPDVVAFCRSIADDAPEEVIETMVAMVAGRLPCLDR